MINAHIKNLSLKQRLRVLMVFPSLVLFLVTSYVYIKDRQNDYTTKVKSDAQSLALGMSSALESSLLSGDRNGIQKLLEATLTKAKEHQLTVYNKDKMVLSTVGISLEGQTISHQVPIYTEAFDIPFDESGVDANTLRATEIIGYMEIKHRDIGFIRKHANEILMAFIILLSVLLNSLLLVEMLGNYIVQNIKKVIKLSEENYSSGEFDRAYHSDDKGELGELFENKERERILVKEMLEKQTSLRIQAESAYITKTKILQQISHELNTPLSSAYGMLQLSNKRIDKFLQKQPEGNASNDFSLQQFSQIRHYLSVGERSIEYLSRFFNDLLAISEEEIYEKKFRRINLSLMIDTIANNHKLDAHTKGLEFELVKNIESHYIFNDDLRISQIANNLLSNAIKYTNDGKVCLSVSTDKTHITIRVIDTGCGIDLRDRERIYKLSERITKDSESTSGKGVGLYVVAKCVECLNGEITLDSALNKHTEFKVTIPLVENSQESEHDVTLRRSGLKIYVIDDDKDNLYAISEILELFDATVITYCSPIDALKNIVSDKPDIAIVDYQLFGMNGVEFIKQARAIFDARNQLSPLFVCCSASGDSIKEELNAEGIDGLLSKPFSIQKIISVINGFYIGKNCLSNSKYKG